MVHPGVHPSEVVGSVMLSWVGGTAAGREAEGAGVQP